ncbi:hypothetical protein ASD64_04825 [Mesorhizobium sp. Root157]|uniref:DUF3168 domain-containing protein n=1 Tax=Mesorhizobium sp. Root157 TaxID=1736477 RepID=UPI0006F58FE4|nr:DUF3168 domain-containing protein [Mesorhizobium sp. Root157]KQZ94197.1 hypothetical protein ASD64_04825 [Mesorhizobium sp. Root157]
MNSAEADLQKALFSELNGDPALFALLGGQKVFDRTPDKVAFPYVTFGRTSIFDWSTGTESGTEQLCTLHIWSKAKGKKEAFDIMATMRAKLDQAPLELNQHHLVNFRFEFAEVRFDDEQAVYHGLLRFRAVIEDI